MKLITPLFFVLMLCLFNVGYAQNDLRWQDKIEPTVWQSLQDGQATDVILYFDQLDVKSGTQTIDSKDKKGQYVFHSLSKYALRQQKNAKQLLNEMQLDYRPFWAVNAIATRVNMHQLAQIAVLNEIKQVLPDEVYQLEKPMVDDVLNIELRGAAITWGIRRIQADSVWEMGIRGKGVVVGGQDTGYGWETSAIKNQYRGYENDTANHNYNWHDAIHEIDANNKDSIVLDSNNPCGLDIDFPCDDHGHGTHTMGTMAGEDEIEKIGVAPESKWIGCRCMERGWGKPSTYIECFEWFIAPTDSLDANPDPSKAPHVINNSWACPKSEGCNTNNFEMMNTVVNNVKAAGIVVVVSAGNSGRRGPKGCGSVITPAAIFESSFSVGAMHPNDTIAGFSSRGPVWVDGSNRTKPDIVAPGVSVRSQLPGGNFANWNGTSMAGPHVAGVVALMINANPKLAGHVDVIENIIEETAWRKFAPSDSCNVDSTAIPNNVYGYGMINALEAVREAQRWISTKIEPITTNFIHLFPNPVIRQIHLQSGKNIEAFHLTIVDISGKIMMEGQYAFDGNEIWTLDVSSLPSGTYIIHIRNNEINQRSKFIKL